MSIRIMSAVWQVTLPASQKIVLLALADNANDDGRCWPSIATLARKCSKSERTVQGVIAELVAAGHLTRAEVPGRSCNYHVHPRSDCTPAKAAPPQPSHETPAETAPHPRKSCAQTIIEPSMEPSEGEPALSVDEVVQGWNDVAGSCGLPIMKKLTAQRRRKLAGRIRDFSVDEWKAAFAAIPRSPFLKGDNPRGWRADFDWLLQPDSIPKLMEGKYDAKPPYRSGK